MNARVPGLARADSVLFGKDGHYGDAATEAMSRLLQDFQRMQRERDDAVQALEAAYRDRLQLAMATEFASDDGVAHLVRVGCIAERLALAMGVVPAQARSLRNASFLFGIGVQDVPGLQSSGEQASSPCPPGACTACPTSAVAATGVLDLGSAARTAMDLGAEVAYAWRERWDGQGVPSQLTGALIPLSARIVAVANLIDGLTRSERSGPMPWRLMCRSLLCEAGTRLDPAVVNAAVALGPSLAALVEELALQRPSLAELARDL